MVASECARVSPFTSGHGRVEARRRPDGPHARALSPVVRIPVIVEGDRRRKFLLLLEGARTTESALRRTLIVKDRIINQAAYHR